MPAQFSWHKILTHPELEPMVAIWKSLALLAGAINPLQLKGTNASQLRVLLIIGSHCYIADISAVNKSSGWATSRNEHGLYTYNW